MKINERPSTSFHDLLNAGLEQIHRVAQHNSYFNEILNKNQVLLMSKHSLYAVRIPHAGVQACLTDSACMVHIMFASAMQFLAIWLSSLSNFPMGLGVPAWVNGRSHESKS